MSKEIFNIISDMSEILEPAQLKRLQEVLVWRLGEEERRREEHTNKEYLEMFLTAKRLEGCSDKTLSYYRFNISRMLDRVDIPVIKVTTENVRQFMVDYQEDSKCCKATIDNIRRILSSFFNWLEEENYVIKSPVKRIHKIKATEKVKEVISDENIETIRDGCTEPRDLALIDLFLSTGMRVGELIGLNIEDIDFENRECVVHGKGDKDRKAYFDARSKIHLKEYIESRTDDNPALFVSLKSPHNRLTTSGIEIRMRRISERLEVSHLHPHKFRRTMATKAIDKGMPIEQVQRLLGHSQIETTLQYAMVKQENVKISHRKFME